ncbi:MAG: hypothetical protein ABIH92_00555 [Nanoarchaeota archaeon]
MSNLNEKENLKQLFYRTSEDELCSRAFRTIHKTLMDNREKYPNSKWLTLTSDEHMKHALLHCGDYFKTRDREHITNALTRIVMADYILNQENLSITIEDKK